MTESVRYTHEENLFEETNLSPLFFVNFNNVREILGVGRLKETGMSNQCKDKCCYAWQGSFVVEVEPDVSILHSLLA